MKKTLLIAGGTGFIGRAVRRYLNDKYRFIVLSREHMEDEVNVQYIKWDGKNLGQWTMALNKADILLNLCGRNVNCRYTKKSRREIYDSRLESTCILGKAMGNCTNPPKVWLNMSTATIYQHETERANDEYQGILGNGFSVEVARKWERMFFEFNLSGVRKVALRTAIVLGDDHGAFPLYRRHVRMGLSGRHGTGKQKVSWIHIEDIARAIDFIMENDAMYGIANLVSPNAVDDQVFMKTLCKKMKYPQGFPLPEWMLELGAFFIRTETELILKSRWVYPKRLLDLGFQFKHDTIAKAFDDLLNNVPKHNPKKQMRIAWDKPPLIHGQEDMQVIRSDTFGPNEPIIDVYVIMYLSNHIACKFGPKHDHLCARQIVPFR